MKKSGFRVTYVTCEGNCGSYSPNLTHEHHQHHRYPLKVTSINININLYWHSHWHSRANKHNQTTRDRENLPPHQLIATAPCRVHTAILWGLAGLEGVLVMIGQLLLTATASLIQAISTCVEESCLSIFIVNTFGKHQQRIIYLQLDQWPGAIGWSYSQPFMPICLQCTAHMPMASIWHLPTTTTIYHHLLTCHHVSSLTSSPTPFHPNLGPTPTGHCRPVARPVARLFHSSPSLVAYHRTPCRRCQGARDVGKGATWPPEMSSYLSWGMIRGSEKQKKNRETVRYMTNGFPSVVLRAGG